MQLRNALYNLTSFMEAKARRSSDALLESTKVPAGMREVRASFPRYALAYQR